MMRQEIEKHKENTHYVCGIRSKDCFTKLCQTALMPDSDLSITHNTLARYLISSFTYPLLRSTPTLKAIHFH